MSGQRGVDETGVIGLGRMGLGIANRVQDAGFDVLGFDVDPDVREEAEAAGIATADSLDDFYERLTEPRRILLVVPSGDPVDQTLEELEPLDADDIVVDCGNCYFENTVRRAEDTDAAYLDCGTSGGPDGEEHGFSLMIGGPEDAYETMEPVFDAIAGGDGYARMGPSGAGHYVKMVHNGIEYAIMQAIGEGFELLHDSDRYPGLDMQDIAETWSDGAVIRSYLMELTAEAFREEGNDLGDVADHVGGGSTGTWTVEEALDQEVPLPLISQALGERFASRMTDGEGRFSRRLANRLRYGFGRHPVARRDEE